MLLPLRDHRVVDVEPVCGYCPLAIPFRLECPALPRRWAQRSPVGGLPSVASIGGTGFPVAALISPLCAGLSCFAAVFGRLRHCRYDSTPCPGRGLDSAA